MVGGNTYFWFPVFSCEGAALMLYLWPLSPYLHILDTSQKWNHTEGSLASATRQVFEIRPRCYDGQECVPFHFQVVFSMVWIHHDLFTHCPTYLGFLRFVSIVNIAVLNIPTMSSYGHVFRPMSGIAGTWGGRIFSFICSWQNASQSALCHFASPSAR